jgi:hypothetical protein
MMLMLGGPVVLRCAVLRRCGGAAGQASQARQAPTAQTRYMPISPTRNQPPK